ncbi:fumarylacetoacetase [Phytomonospora endophytica]|uniref:fumarylacetoacetase n=1 Tax=Phytomonospora endophytica TaxID=714109 RepID=A0A841FN06_9ACTN|nr:fumarylacetoacetase [Phytomonospora endophytica]MBB6037486.1 fumarylacetoacetase [Phytomonospora endophytica]GIG70737.1 putative fumarylacetoacetase [Phytomonospora endophytica]
MTWVASAVDSRYGVENLPYGVFSTPNDSAARLGVRIGDEVLDLRRVAESGQCATCPTCSALRAPTLNAFMARGREVWSTVRGQVQSVLTDPGMEPHIRPMMTPLAKVTMHAPFLVADYVDFYSSEHHATNLGRMFRPDSEALLPNWKHLPVGYHGRAGTVVPSGTPIVRPQGQRRTPDGEIVFGPSARLDIEAEVGFVVGVPTVLGHPAGVDEFREHVFGAVLVNDWSARDIQAWEYVPLGPFLGKSFATSVSQWVTPLDALDDAEITAPVQDPEVLPYLIEKDRYGYDLRLSVKWNGTEVSRPPFADMYWTPAQQLAHMTVNGAGLRTGDLYASGTVSGPAAHQRGSFIELTWGGKEPVTLGDGATRTFLEDGDTVELNATAMGTEGRMIGLGEVVGTVHSH